jgi:glucosamine-6-phosphate deaminase
MAQEGLVSFAQATTFNLDEYVGLDAAYSQSYAAFMREHFWKWVDLPDKAIHIPCGTAPDLREECARYDEELEKAGGIDIQILGLGLNGHIGFNEPSHDLLIRTHVVHLTPETVEANAYHFSGVHFVPRQALTMGIGSIMQSGKILLLVSGAQKKEILNKTLFGPVSTEVPASILQLHPNLTVLTDIRLDQS